MAQKEHTNIDPYTNIDKTKGYEMPDGKCDTQFEEHSYKDILVGNAPELDMGVAPYVNRKNGKK